MRPWDSINRLLPRGTERRRVFNLALARARPGHWAVAAERFSRDYERWMRECEPTTAAPVVDLAVEPLVSVVMPCFNTRPSYLEAAVDSVLAQSYRNWQLCLVDASSDRRRAARLQRAATRDERIEYLRIAENRGISANTNHGIRRARGMWVVFLDHDDTIAPNALYELVRVVNAHPETQLVYSDQDKLDDRGRRRSEPLFKPDFSPDMLEALMYMGHLLAIERGLLKRVGDLRSDLDGSQDYDLALRCCELTDRIRHIPKVLYHWRMARGSTARGIRIKPESGSTGAEAVAQHLERIGVEAAVSSYERQPAYYRVRLHPPRHVSASVIVAAQDASRAAALLASLAGASTAEVGAELVVAGSDSLLAKLHVPAGLQPRLIPLAAHCSLAASYNAGRANAKGDILVFCHDDLVPGDATWLEELVACAARPNHGPVAPLLLGPDGTVASAGLVLSPSGVGQPYRGLRPSVLTPFGLPTWPRNCLAVADGCLAIRAHLFDSTDGFQPVPAPWSAVEICLQLHDSGMLTTYWPHARMVHQETCVPATPEAPAVLRDRLTSYLGEAGDPFFNPNLELRADSITVRRPAGLSTHR